MSNRPPSHHTPNRGSSERVQQPDLTGETVPAKDMLAARKVAIDILSQILRRKLPLDQVFESHHGFAALSMRDRGFVRMMVSTTLRRMGQIDHVLTAFVARPLDQLRPAELLDVLRLGAAQLLFMDVPSHAAVNTSVMLAEDMSMNAQKSLVNAVLRRVGTEGPPMLRHQDAGRLNTPEWLWHRWVSDYGDDAAKHIAVSNLEEAALDITVKNPANINTWSDTLDAEIMPLGTLRKPAGGRIQDLSGYNDGMWWVQDMAASLPVKLMGPLRGLTVADLCAAPGGKTCQLIASGALVTAVDRSASRLARLAENLKRLRLTIQKTETADAAVWNPPEKFDAVLLDAPCSATGTIRRHPDLPHHKAQVDVDRLADLQTRLLANAANMIKSGGMLLYCTCSLQKDEGERQIERFLTSHPNFKRQPITAAEVPGLETALTPNGELRTLPYMLATKGGIDGFYIARLRKA